MILGRSCSSSAHVLTVCRCTADTVHSLQRLISVKDFVYKVAFCDLVAQIFVHLITLSVIDKYCMWVCDYLAIIALAGVTPSEWNLPFPAPGAKSSHTDVSADIPSLHKCFMSVKTEALWFSCENWSIAKWKPWDVGGDLVCWECAGCK